jgi:acetylglutamate kinase
MTKIKLRSDVPSSATNTANMLIASLPWLKQYRDKVIVIKFGGNAMVSEELQAAFADDIAYLRHVGIQPVVVHGGGPQISEMLDRLGIESEFRGGYRVTNKEAIEVVRMVLQGMVNPQIVSLINKHGPLAVGFSGEDATIFKARRMSATVNGEEVDLGFVGEVQEVDPGPVLEQLRAGRVPVISTISPDIDDPGETLNVNADMAASALAVALRAARLLLLTDVEGLYADWPNKDSLISEITADELRARMDTLESGMIPKMRSCLEAVEGGVERATVIDGRVPHSVLVEMFTDDGAGTLVRLGDE